MSMTTLPEEDLDLTALGKPISGPRALTGDWGRFWNLTFNIAKTQWKMRFFGSVLGYFWQLVRPLMLFGVLYVFFTVIAKVGAGDSSGPGQPNHFYGVQLLAAIVLFTFFGDATSGAVRSVLDSEGLVRKIHFPRLAIPLAVVLVGLFNLVLNLVVVAIFALASGVTPRVSWLMVFPLIFILFVLVSGLAMLLSSLFVHFRDIQPIWEVLSQVIFYASPIVIPITTVAKTLSPTLTHLYMLNPLAVVIQQFRHSVINPAAYGAAGVAGGYGVVAGSMAIVVVVFGLGFWVFNRTAPLVAENL